MIYSRSALCLLGLLAYAGQSSAAAVVSNDVQLAMEAQQPSNVIVKMKDSTNSVLAQSRSSTFATRSQKIQFLADALEKHAEASQKDIKKFLSSNTRSVGDNKVRSFWISNSLLVKNASPEEIQALQARDDVAEIIAEPFIPISPLLEDEGVPAVGDVEWGIDRVGANTLWYDGITGENVIVGSIDTGVRVTHEAVADNYVGAEENGWLDPYALTNEPNDQNGHGTHTMATIAGSHGVGVAPGARWLSCKGCQSNGCSGEALLACGQYILCPTDSNGENADCSKAPHVSSNSWGGGQGRDWYQEVVDAWQAAGIVPVFANGNSGPQCGTANSPGEYANVLAVGATTIGNELAWFSSVGPAVNGLMKPEVSAPGHQVRSAWYNGDSSYKSISGTSMACPHVSGVVALMLSQNPELSYDAIKNALTGTCSTADLKPTGQNCGGESEESYPNNAYGHGLVDAVSAVGSIGDYEPPAPTDPPVGTECSWSWYKFSCQPSDECYWSWFRCLARE